VGRYAIKGRGVAAAAVLGATLVVVPAAEAQSTQGAALAASGGKSTITLSKSASKRNKKAKVRVTASKGASASSKAVTLPISGGTVDPASFKGLVSHKGKLTLKRGRRMLGLTGVIVTVGQRSTVGATLRGQRAGVFSLDTRDAKYVRNGVDGGTLSNVRVKLSEKYAKALNRILKTKAYKKGQLLGTMTVTGKLAQALVQQGAAQLALNPAALQSLASQGVSVTPAPPAALSGNTLTVPVSVGAISIGEGATLLDLDGGLTLTKGSTSITLDGFEIEADGNTATLNVTGPISLPFSNLSGSFAPVFGNGNSFEIENISSTLTVQAAAALEKVGIHVPADLDLGDIVITGIVE
jgi:hypothetical protein